MGDGTGIEWTDATWNPIRAMNKETGGVGHYCVKVSEGCRHCYAERIQKRLFRNPIRFAAQDRDQVELYLDEEMLLQPLRWKRPRLIFVCSVTDLFLEHHADWWIDRMFGVMAMAPQHTFQVLTKRPERALTYLRQGRKELTTRWGFQGAQALHQLHGGSADRAARLAEASNPGTWPLPNVILGTSAENQYWADRRVPQLLSTPAAARFVSWEPALGMVDFSHLRPPGDGLVYDALGGLAVPVKPEPGAKGETTPRLDWVVAGGESDDGGDARPSDLAWYRAVRDQCLAAGVPFFMKQLSQADSRGFKKYETFPPDLQVRQWPTVGGVERKGRISHA